MVHRLKPSDLRDSVDVEMIAARFHNAAATASACARAAERCGTRTVVLSGGVFQNRRLLGQTAALLAVASARLAREGRAGA